MPGAKRSRCRRDFEEIWRCLFTRACVNCGKPVCLFRFGSSVVMIMNDVMFFDFLDHIEVLYDR